MAQPTLKSLLGKKSETTAWLQAWTTLAKAEIAVEDNQHNVLFGIVLAGEPQTFAVLLDDEMAGYVKGDDNAAIIARLLSLLLQKEAEKKKLGTEVLNLYQELNVIYNFSEKLTETIDPDVIAQLTLEQAIHSIPSNSGVIVLWDEESRQLTIPATAGEPLFNEEGLHTNSGILLKIGLSGQSEIMSDLFLLKEKGIIKNEVQSLIYAAMKVKHRILGAIILAGKDAEQYTAAHLKLLVTLALQSSTAIESAMLYEKNIREVREREEALRRVYEATAKFVPHEFIDSLGHHLITDIKLGDHVEKIVTVLFSDIRDFTGISEKMTPQENFRFVCSFNERMGPIIKKYGGFINQYLGDAIMAIFPGNAAGALSAAIEMQQEVEALNQQRQADGQPLIQIGVGMHTGPLIMGITGDLDRMDATTISDTVNTASRIESLTKHYKAGIILSDASLQQIEQKEKFYLRQLGRVQLKGKQETVKIHECFSGNSNDEMQQKEETLAFFNEGIMHYLDQSFQQACNAFQKVMDIHPGDQTAIFFYKSSVHYLDKGIPESWVGAVEMQNK